MMCADMKQNMLWCNICNFVHVHSYWNITGNIFLRTKSRTLENKISSLSQTKKSINPSTMKLSMTRSIKLVNYDYHVWHPSWAKKNNFSTKYSPALYFLTTGLKNIFSEKYFFHEPTHVAYKSQSINSE